MVPLTLNIKANTRISGLLLEDGSNLIAANHVIPLCPEKMVIHSLIKLKTVAISFVLIVSFLLMSFSKNHSALSLLVANVLILNINSLKYTYTN
jgi:hypothetical protein